jgi:hypothetical protein
VALPPSDGARSYTQNNGELDDGEVGELGRPIREQTVASSNRSEAIKFTSSAIARMPEPQPRRPTTSHKKRARVLGKADMTADIPKAPLLTDAVEKVFLRCALSNIDSRARVHAQ